MTLTRKITTEELFFFLYFIPMLLLKGLGFTDGSIYKGVILFSFLMILCKILACWRSYSIPEYLFIISLLAVSFLVWLQSRNIAVLMGCLMVLSMKGIDPRKVFRIGAILWGICYGIQVFAGMTGITQPQFVIHNKFHLGYIIRWAFGYSHPNVLQISYTVLILYILYGFGKGQSLRKLVCFLLIAATGACYIFFYSLSLTGMLSFFVAVFFALYFESNRYTGRQRSSVENVLLELVFPAAVLFSVFAPILLTGRAFDFLNRLMTTRPSLTRYFLENYPITAFGENFSGLPAVYTLDCSYANLLMNGGLVIFLLMCVAYLITIHTMLREAPGYGNSSGLTIIYTAVLTAVSEPFAFNTSYKNISLFLIGSCLYSVLEYEDAVLKTKFRKQVQNHGESADGCEMNDSCLSTALPSPSEGKFETTQTAASSRRFHITSRKLPPAAVFLLCALFLAGGLAGDAVYRSNAHPPKEIYALRSDCDTDDNSVSVYLTPEETEELIQSGDAWILSYTDASTPLLRFDGITIEAEYFRGRVSSFLWTGILFDLAALLAVHCGGFFCRKEKNSKVEQHSPGSSCS
jgi:hypothetical protein